MKCCSAIIALAAALGVARAMRMRAGKEFALASKIDVDKARHKVVDAVAFKGDPVHSPTKAKTTKSANVTTSNTFEDQYGGVWKQHPQRHEKKQLTWPLKPHGLNGTLCDVKQDVFPCTADFRDPNKAWTINDKFVFLSLYLASLVVFCWMVHHWSFLATIATGLFRKSDQGQSAGQASGKAASPQFDTESEAETVFGPMVQYPVNRRVMELFEDHVKKQPSAVALIPDGAASLTYADLDRAAEEVATQLLSAGVSVGDVVALILDRSVAQVVAIYGVLKAGAAYVPVDPDAPPQRKQFLVANGDAKVVIAVDSSESMMSQLFPDQSVLLLDAHRGAVVRPIGGQAAPKERSRPSEKDMALLIYTSGTTGQPKGIIYSHTHLMHGSYFMGWQCEMGPQSVSMLKSPYIWAVIEYEMFPALINGGKMFVASPSGHKSPEYLAESICMQKVDTLFITPQVLDLVLDINEGRGLKLLTSLKHIVTCGEPLGSTIANRCVEMLPGTGLHNFYGASESSCAVYSVPRSGIDLSLFPSKAPAGKPQPHAQVYVIREEEHNGQKRLVRVAPGQPGEICFGGVLATGYWKHDDLTAEKWVQTDGGLLYRSGDLGRWRAGQLEVVGRTDRQVKVRGVRVEPEEVEAVLKKYTREVPDPRAPVEGSGGVSQRAVLKDVSVVASSEPSELVAFATLRDGVLEHLVTPEGLRKHCSQTDLSPSYMPKFFVILDQASFPKLPNGKPDLKALQVKATKHVGEEGEMFLDSLGQMKKASKGELFENAVIHRCYSFWMLGVLMDHYMRCYSDASFCTILARQAVRPWSEMLVRSFGNDQDLFGFILLGAYQDARPEKEGAKPRVKLGVKDLFTFAVYLFMAIPMPQLLHFFFGTWAWPMYWNGHAPPASPWGVDFMSTNSLTSEHRWYLLMVLQARVFMQLGEWMRLPGWLQVFVFACPCLIPSSTLKMHEHIYDICADKSISSSTLYMASWLFRNWGSSCPAFERWMQAYGACYVWAFHYLRPFVDFVKAKTPAHMKTPTFGAIAFSTSMLLGVLMAMFHYPNNFLENGTGVRWAWLEIGVDFVQPALLTVGMCYLPWNMSWWGQTALGSYVFHYYFSDQIGLWTWQICSALAWDVTGLLTYAAVLTTCFLFATIIGPLGHYFLISPVFLYERFAGRKGTQALQKS